MERVAIPFAHGGTRVNTKSPSRAVIAFRTNLPAPRDTYSHDSANAYQPSATSSVAQRTSE